MDFILHCGAHRCATTSFQRVLDRNRAGLLQAGVVAWTPEKARGGLFGGVMMQPGRALPQHDRRAARAARDIGVERALLERAEVPVLLLSEENAIGSIPGNLRAGELYPDLAARIGRLRRALPGPWRRIGLSIRRYDDYWTSCLAFAVAQGHPPPDDAGLARLAGQGRGWRHVAVDLACAAPEAEIVILPHERFAGHPDDQMTALLGGAGLPPFAQDPRHHNASPSAAGLRQVLAGQGRAEHAAAIPDDPARWTPFSAPQRRALVAQYDEDLAWFRAGAGGLARIGKGRAPAPRPEIGPALATLNRGTAPAAPTPL